MQIELLPKNDIESKLKTRSLYESCFDEGKDSFIDYYYDTIIKRNEIVVARDGDEIVSMIHLNPYVYCICGELKRVHYLVAIATKDNYRHRGLMKLCFDKAIEYLNELKEPFCYLVPDNIIYENIYKKYGFDVVAKFTLDKFSDKVYDIYPDKNEEYVRLMKNEEYYLSMESKEYIEDLKNKNVMFKVLDSSTNYNIDFFKSKKIYVCQEV
ncbi:MAG: GNAT family N-acetyltransferase [Lachnospiraceae bacterium]|nr:GNAT family N-acetyltransferase [Lachnospiraceae bacterium]